jgi:hypothetical protein
MSDVFWIVLLGVTQCAWSLADWHKHKSRFWRFISRAQFVLGLALLVGAAVLLALP